MKYFWILFLCVIFTAPVYGIQKSISPETLRAKSVTARSILEKERAHSYIKKINKKNKIIAREILLAVYSEQKDKVEIVRLKIPVPQTRNPKNFIFSVLTPGYKVEWIRGRGVTHLAFKVFDKNGEEMTILDAKHIFLRSEDDPLEVLYFPFSDDFLNKEFSNQGLSFLLSKVEEAENELCDLDVSSRAFPGKSLCKIFPDALLVTLAFIEQIDDGEFNGGCPTDNCNKYSVNKVLAHFARNNEDAFGYSVSRTGARGLMQFMNSKKIPTYNFVKQKYPEAKLIPDFINGTRDIKNSIKAAICLLDYNLVILPEGARREYLANPKIWGIFPVAAYNGGPGRALKLYKAFRGKKVDLNNFKIPNRALSRETRGYLQKYLAVWDILTQSNF